MKHEATDALDEDDLDLRAIEVTPGGAERVEAERPSALQAQWPYAPDDLTVIAHSSQDPGSAETNWHLPLMTDRGMEARKYCLGRSPPEFLGRNFPAKGWVDAGRNPVRRRPAATQ